MALYFSGAWSLRVVHDSHRLAQEKVLHYALVKSQAPWISQTRSTIRVLWVRVMEKIHHSQ